MASAPAAGREPDRAPVRAVAAVRVLAGVVVGVLAVVRVVDDLVGRATG